MMMLVMELEMMLEQEDRWVVVEMKNMGGWIVWMVLYMMKNFVVAQKELANGLVACFGIALVRERIDWR